MEGLTIESFNEILFGALKASVKKSELLAKELEMAYGLKVQAMEDVIYCLTYNEPYRVALDKVYTIDANCDRLAQMLEAAQQEEADEGKEVRE